MSLTRAMIPYFAGFKFDQQEYTGNSLTVTGNSIAAKPDGTRILTLSGRTVNIYDLSTPGDLSTASANGTISLPSLRVSSNTNSLRFNADGTKLFVMDTDDTTVHAFDLSTAYGGTATYDTELDIDPCRFFDFSDDGQTLIGMVSEQFYDISLSTGFDLSTAGALSGVVFSVAAVFPTIRGIRFGDSGRQLLTCEVDTGAGDDRIRKHNIATANDLSTGTVTINNFIGDVTADGGGAPLDMTYAVGGRRLYVMATNTVLEYRTTG